MDNRRPTQREIAQRVGVSEPTLSLHLSGRVPLGSVKAARVDAIKREAEADDLTDHAAGCRAVLLRFMDAN